MSRPGGKTIAIFALAFVIAALATVPASVLSRVAERASNGRVLLANASGTFWQGSGTPALRRQGGNFLVLQKLHWDIAILPFFTGKMSARLRWEGVEQEQPMTVVFSYGQVEVHKAVIPVPAAVLGELVPLLQPVQLSGNILIKSDQFTHSSNGDFGNAAANWTNAGSVLSVVSPLGNYQLSVTGNGKQLDLSLITVSGALLLEGKGNYSPNLGLKFKATARASSERKDGLNELLSNFGPESAPGVHTLSLVNK